MNFDGFFKLATGHDQGPFDYQRRLSRSDSGTNSRSQLINIPTGLGKTAAVVLAWVWNRVQLQNPKWPRRLVYCLPIANAHPRPQSLNGVALFTFSCPALASINQAIR